MYTELEAVNKLLRGASIEPVETLEFPDADITMARSALYETSIEVQGFGWWFNQEDGWSLGLDSNGRVPCPSGVLSMQGADQLTGRNITKRNNYLYDVQTHSTDLSEFVGADGNVLLNFVMWIQWDDLPSTAQNYVMIKASRRFALDVDLDVSKIQYNVSDEGVALGILQRDDIRNRRLNALNSPFVGAVLGGMSSQNSVAGFGNNPTGGNEYE